MDGGVGDGRHGAGAMSTAPRLSGEAVGAVADTAASGTTADGATGGAVGTTAHGAAADGAAGAETNGVADGTAEAADGTSALAFAPRGGEDGATCAFAAGKEAKAAVPMSGKESEHLIFVVLLFKQQILSENNMCKYISKHVRFPFTAKSGLLLGSCSTRPEA